MYETDRQTRPSAKRLFNKYYLQSACAKLNQNVVISDDLAGAIRPRYANLLPNELLESLVLMVPEGGYG